VDELEVAEDGAEVDDDAEGYQRDPRPEGEPCGVGREMGFGGAEFAEEEAEAADCEADAHEAESGAYPGEKGALGGEVDSGILFCWLVHAGIVRQDISMAGCGVFVVVRVPSVVIC
jgi:hypothetical protein